MDKETLVIFLILVFGAVFLLTQSIVVPTFGTGRQESKRLRQRLGGLADESRFEEQLSLVRQKYLRKLSPFARTLQGLPGMDERQKFIERAGHEFPAYRLVLLSALFGAVAGMIAWILSHNLWLALGAFPVFGYAPTLKLKRDLGLRFAKFEEQLPEALDVITRALRAGYPFNEALQVVATEMEAPIASEFRIVFEEINFGLDTRLALRSLVDRMPSLSLMAIITTVTVQRETGGNLAETLENISKLIRNRFRFQRKVRTLTAEARMSSWVLVMVPFVLFAVISLTAPDYLAPLIQDPLGRQVIWVGVALLVAGNLWIRRIIAIEI